jgi:uncharacterized membrane protein
MNMDLVFPDDARDARARSDRNLSEVERWASIAAGAGLAAYGLSRLKSTGWVYAGIGASDTRAALRGSRGVNVLESVTINRPVADLYRFWRNLENLPQFMRHLESVEKVTDTISHWRAKGPAGVKVEWDAEIYNEIPNKLIAWRSLEGADVVSAGSVNFDEERDARGTRVTVHLQYSPPGGKLGAAVAKLFGRDAETEIREDLRRFKQLIEAGEVPTTSGQPRGR